MIDQYIFRNKYKAALVSFLFGTLLTACVDDNGLSKGTVADSPTIQLRLSTDDLITRAKTGEPAFTGDEKKMHTVDLYFFGSDAIEEENSTALKWVQFTDKTHENNVTINIPNDSISVIFGSDNKCRVYAVVNVSSEEFKASGTDQRKPTLKALRELKAKTPSFAEKFNGFAMFTKAGDGDELTYDATTRTAEGTVKVKNLASKIDIFASFGGEGGIVTGTDPTGKLSGDQKWKIYEGKEGKSNEAFIIDGVQTVPLNGWSDDDYSAGNLTKNLSGDDYFDTRTSETNHYFKASEEKDKEKYPWVIAEPFYSYPNQWSNDALELHQTYLMLKVNWLPYKMDEKDPNVEDWIVETYYKIPINVADGLIIKSRDKLLSNVYYRVKVNINTLGGINYGEPVELKDCSWEALDWGESRLDAEIHEIRWLEITQKQKDVYDGVTYQAIMNNTNSVTLSYNSTHSIYLKKVEMWYWNFNTSNPFDPEEVNVTAYRINKSKTLSGTTKRGELKPEYLSLTKEQIEQIGEENANGFYIDQENQKITFYHVLYPIEENGTKKIYTKIGDKTYSPFFVTFTLAHVDKPDFEKTYTIKQYPGVYVTFEKNTGKTYNTDGYYVSMGRRVSDGGNGSADRLGVYINGGATDTWRSTAGSGFNGSQASNSLQLGGIGGEGRSSNTNMYSIHVTQLSEDDLPVSVVNGASQQPGKIIIHGKGEVDVKFHIGDPRTKFVNNYLAGDEDLIDTEVTQLWTGTSYPNINLVWENTLDNRSAFRKAPATTGDGNAQRLYHKNETSLRYYYPTAEGQLDEQAFMIAPIFRMSSGASEVFIGNSGRSSDRLKRENARRRCAALQENGYPAGRWRLPTIGEILFFKMLQNKNVLPEIFPKDDGKYRSLWTAQYLFKFDQDNSDIRPYSADDSQDHKWVRCVYDDWYWVKQDADGNWVQDNIQNHSVPRQGALETYYPGSAMTSSMRLQYYDKYSADGDMREMFVWGDKEKNNPQEQPN